MNLEQWVQENPVREEMCWKGAAEKSFPGMVSFAKAWAGEDDEIEVVSSHTSKSIRLPVIRVSGRAGTIYLRDNFHDVKISFECADNIEHDLFGITAGTSFYLSPCYFEGFDKSWVFPGFRKGSRNFSVCIGYERANELAGAINAYFAKDQEDQLRIFEYHSDLVRRLQQEENMALNYGLPFVKTQSLLRSFQPKDHNGPINIIVPANELILSFALSYEWSYREYKTLSFPTLDFTQGIACPQEDWLKALAKIIDIQRNVKTAYLGEGAKFSFVGIDNDLQKVINRLGLDRIFKNDKKMN